MRSGAESSFRPPLGNGDLVRLCRRALRVEHRANSGPGPTKRTTRSSHAKRAAARSSSCASTPNSIAGIQATHARGVSRRDAGGDRDISVADFGAYYRLDEGPVRGLAARRASASARDAVPPRRSTARCVGGGAALQRRPTAGRPPVVRREPRDARTGTSSNRTASRTLAALADCRCPCRSDRRAGAAGTYESLREQARLQLAQRDSRPRPHLRVAGRRAPGSVWRPFPSRGRATCFSISRARVRARGRPRVSLWPGSARRSRHVALRALVGARMKPRRPAR